MTPATDPITLREGRDVPRDALRALYAAVGWTAYTEHPDALVRAVANSTWVLSAWQDERLLGLIRVMSDDVSILYVQDILVHPEAQRNGVGRRLMEAALARFAHVRQKVLITDDEPRQHAFYRVLGFTDTRTLERTPVRTFVCFEGVKLG